MGCGEICGVSLSLVEISKQAQKEFKNKFQQITPNKFLFPIKSINNFANQMKLYPERFNLMLTEKLIGKSIISANIMEKWKIILFCIDSNIITYVNCLGYTQIMQSSKINQRNGTDEENNNQQIENNEMVIQNIELFEHKAFTQIEKDIERTFPGYNFEKKSFATILKRITNHFPNMGYTQGINFIIGYLLIIGFSQMDTFWLFVHMAINRRYLLLGLYEDGFPLINVYISIFRNMLKRLNDQLYRHLFEKVQMFDESAWIFKWFMTCYLCSFPLEMCKHIWDFVLCTSGLGFIKFAISLVMKLEKYILDITDACDLTEFFSNLKEIQFFNSYLSIKDIIKSLENITIIKSDLKDLSTGMKNNVGSDFYRKYISVKFQEDSQYVKTIPSQPSNHPLTIIPQTQSLKNGTKQSMNLLDKWYNKLVEERKQFKIDGQQKNGKNIGEVVQQQITIQFIQSSKQIIEPIQQIQFKNQNKIDHKQRTSMEHFDSLKGLIIQQQQIKKFQKEPKYEKCQPPSQTKSPGKTKQKMLTNSNRYGEKQLKDKKEIDNNINEEQQQIEQNKDTIQIQDEYIYLPKDIKIKKRNSEKECNDILSQFSNVAKCKQNNNYAMENKLPSQKIGSATDVNINMQKSKLAKAGNTVISSMSASIASARSSASSHKTTQKENEIVNSRACKYVKNKIEENNLEIPETVKYLRSNIRPEEREQHQYSMENINMHSVRKRVNTSHDWMANSDLPAQSNNNLAISNVRHQQQIVSQVEIPNVRMFKKKNNNNKIDILPIAHHCQNTIEPQISQCHSRVQPNPALGEQQSCQSVFIGNNSERERKSQACDIQSVK